MNDTDRGRCFCVAVRGITHPKYDLTSIELNIAIFQPKRFTKPESKSVAEEQHSTVLNPYSFR